MKLLWGSHEQLLEVHIFYLSYRISNVCIIQTHRLMKSPLPGSSWEKPSQSCFKALLAQLWPVVGHRGPQLFTINHVKNFIRNWESVLQCVTERSRKDTVSPGFSLWLLQKPLKYKTEDLRTATIPWFLHYPNWKNFWAGTCEKLQLHCPSVGAPTQAAHCGFESNLNFWLHGLVHAQVWT